MREAPVARRWSISCAVWAGAVTGVMACFRRPPGLAGRMARPTRRGRIRSSRTYRFFGRPGSGLAALVYPWRHR